MNLEFLFENYDFPASDGVHLIFLKRNQHIRKSGSKSPIIDKISKKQARLRSDMKILGKQEAP